MVWDLVGSFEAGRDPENVNGEEPAWPSALLATTCGHQWEY